MTRNFPSVPSEMNLTELTSMFTNSRHHGFPVVDKTGNLKGVVTLADIESKMASVNKNLSAADIATTNLIIAYPDESLHDVLHKLGNSEVGRIPVVDRKEPSKLIGILRRHDIVKAYTKAQAQMSNP